MTMIIGNMRYDLTVSGYTETKDSYGAVIPLYTLKYKLKAAQKVQKGQLTTNNMETFNTNIITFITYYRNILTTDRIEFEGRLYKINGYPVEIGFKEGLEVTCELINI